MMEHLRPAEQRTRLATMGALVAGALTFLFVGIFDELLKIGAGALVGAVVGVLVWAQLMRRQRDRTALDLSDQTKVQLEDEARRLGIEGRSNMTKDELAAAIAARKQHHEVGSTGELLVGTMDVVSSKVEQGVNRLGGKVRQAGSSGDDAGSK